MQMKKLVAPLIGATILFGAAQAEPVGVVSNVDGDVFAIRGNENVALVSGDSVMVNDRIIARSGSAATVEAFGCSSSLDAGSIVMVDANMCDQSPVNFGFAQLGPETTTLFVVGAMLAVPAVVGIAADSEDGPTNTAPTSP